MELKDLEEAVENMILQHNYPGFEARSLNLALPVAFNDAPAKLYSQALSSSSIYVQLFALRWFQTKTNAAKSYVTLIAPLLENADPWIRRETVRTMETAKIMEPKSILKISALLRDPDQIVRIEAAKALGNLLKESDKTGDGTRLDNGIAIKDTIIEALKEASNDSVQDVRRKAIKSLRKLGAFSTS